MSNKTTGCQEASLSKQLTDCFLLRPILLLITLCCLCVSASGQSSKPPTDFDLIENLNDRWLVFDNAYQSYVPYLPDRYPVQYTLNLVLSSAQYRSYQLLLQSNQYCYVFVQSRLVKDMQANEQMALNLDSLEQSIKGPTILLSLYCPEGYSSIPSAQIVFPRPQNVKVVSLPKEPLQAKLRESNSFLNFLLIASVFVLGLYAFLWNYHRRAFMQYFNLRLMLPGAIREDIPMVNKPLSGSSLLFVLAHSFLLGLFYLTIQQGSQQSFANVLSLDISDQFWPITRYFLLITSLIFVMLLGKYILIQAVGSVFRLTSVTHVHYYEYLLFSRVFYTVVVVIQFALFLMAPIWMTVVAEVVIWIILLFNIIRIIIINSVLSKLTSAKNLYLFSYLCTTELIPLLIGIKILIK